MLKEHDRVILTTDLSAERLRSHDVGTIVHVHQQGEAFEVEFLALDGHMVAVATVTASQLRPVSTRDITHARAIELPA
ncbi:MAG: DUF4926 domain-containing protein [Dehalococcoidia bacterium]|nr:DUF4926 domain-containing protein [Dehalococcoidia bacterium]